MRDWITGRIVQGKIREVMVTASIMPTEALKAARNIRTLPIAELLGIVATQQAEGSIPHRHGRA
ncbi:MAG: hypothetical protein MUC44_07530 [Beijerinckiaceae bacterium]|nr:hypothetical protein [Beijerinckiaceae bacterium]